MKLWMDIQRDLEGVMSDHERILDAWREGGVDGVVFGPLVFGQQKLTQNAQALPSEGPVAPTYDPNPAVYARLGVEAPAPPEHKLPEKRALLEQTMSATKDRGMQVYIMYADGGAGPGGPGYYLHDPQTLASRVARMVDTLEHYPMADGVVMDGPEWGYEMAPHHMDHRSYFFNDLPESVAPMAKDLGYDYAAMVAAKDRLLALFHDLDPKRIRSNARGGLVGASQELRQLLGVEPISGGENISSIDVEDALYSHPSILEAAVVARPDSHWGETPCAFVNLKPEAAALTEDDIITFCREKLAGFKCPRTVVFGDLPKPTTGKIQKFKLRAQAEQM